MNTNNALIILGICSILFGVIGKVSGTKVPEPEPKPTHGDRRITRSSTGSISWEKYIEYPGWQEIKQFGSIEEAKLMQSRWDSVRNQTSEVIKP